MKKVISFLLMGIIFIYSSTGTTASCKLFNIEKAYSYSSIDYNSYLKKLVNKYKDLLESEEIGKSTDGRPITAVRMRVNDGKDRYAGKLNILVEAGTHARENINPAVVSNMIEDYCLDYYNDSTIKEISIKNELKDSIIHFIVLTNPDGHDISKFGTSTIRNKALMNGVSYRGYKQFKANVKGVDINRNYPDTYFDGKKWVNIWGKLISDQECYEPSAENYRGKKAGSELETQALMKYMLKYDFRIVISYHSMGRDICYDRPQLSKEFNNTAFRYAQVIHNTTGYKISPPEKEANLTSGFMSHYFNGNTLKPFITIETTNCIQPSTKKYFKTEYGAYKLYLAPIKVLELARNIGYYNYKVYKDGIYVRDVMEKGYADAIAKKIGGKVIIYKGKPILEEESIR